MPRFWSRLRSECDLHDAAGVVFIDNAVLLGTDQRFEFVATFCRQLANAVLGILDDAGLRSI